MSFEDIIKKTIKEITTVRKIAAQQLLKYDQDIDLIIKSEIKDGMVIEPLLDILLDFQTLGLGEKAFLKLNNYYHTINSEAANFYKKEYLKAAL